MTSQVSHAGDLRRNLYGDDLATFDLVHGALDKVSFFNLGTVQVDI